MKTRINAQGSKIIYLNDDTVCVVPSDDRLLKINQKGLDEFDFVSVYVSIDELKQLMEELSK